MKIEKTKEFVKTFDKLPQEIQELFTKQEEIFIQDWTDSRLHIKRNKELKGVFSFRITRRYRVFFVIKQESAVFFIVGHRKNVYK